MDIAPSNLTADRLRQLLLYDPDTGIFTWIESQRAGSEAGCIGQLGYRAIQIGNKSRERHYAHRLAWFFMTGKWPKGKLDHINGNKRDNRWSNLRIANIAQNNANRRRQRNNSTGFKGVTIERGRFRAQLMVNRKNLHLGRYHTAEEAHAAYCEAAKEHFGEFANPG